MGKSLHQSRALCLSPFALISSKVTYLHMALVTWTVMARELGDPIFFLGYATTR